MLIHRLPSIAPVVITSVLVLSGCATGNNSSGAVEEHDRGGIKRVTNESQVTRPIDAHLPGSRELLQIRQVHDQALNECLAEKGVTPKKDANPPDLAASVNADIRRRATRATLWGFFDTTNAAQHGYAFPAATGPDSSTLPAKDYFDSYEPAIILECIQNAQSSLPDSAKSEEDTSARVLPDGGPTVPFDDSRYVAAVTEWSTCMKERGFNYLSPFAALYDDRWPRAEVADAQQIATATADVECKISTNLVGIALAIQTEHDQNYIDTHQEALAQFRSDLDTYLRNATTKN